MNDHVVYQVKLCLVRVSPRARNQSEAREAMSSGTKFKGCPNPVIQIKYHLNAVPFQIKINTKINS